MKYPRENWKQRGDTDLDGLWSSFALDLANKNKKGKVLFSPRALINYSSDDDVDLGLAVAFRYVTATGWYAICGAKIFQNGSTGTPNTTRSPFTTFFETTDTGTPPTNCNVNSDMELYPKNDNLYVTAPSTLTYFYNGSTWASFTAGTGGFIKKLCYFRAQNRMYMSYGVASITSWDEGNTAIVLGNQYSLNLGASAQNYITSLVPASDYIWILTLNLAGTTSRQYFWDGSQATGPNGFAELDSNGALAGIIKDNSLWIVDTEGRLLQNNGGAFVEKARFPFGGKMPLNSLNTSASRWIHPNGITLKDGKINILINNALQDGGITSERCPAGVWEYEEGIGLYHKLPMSYSPKATGAITDYGQHNLSAVGALISAKHTSTNNGDMLIGASYYSDATTVKSAIFINDSLNTILKYASLATEWLVASGIKDNFNQVIPRIRQLLSSAAKIAMKYRTNEGVPINITGTWTSTSSFTTPTDLRAYIGYEVTVLNGTGGGKTAHILSVTEGTNWIVVLDDTFTGVTTGTFIGRVQNWKKAGQIFSNTVEDSPEFPTPEAGGSNKVQVKLCEEGTGDNEIYDLILDNKKQQ